MTCAEIGDCPQLLNVKTRPLFFKADKEWYNTPFDLFFRETGRESKQTGYEYRKIDPKIHITE